MYADYLIVGQSCLSRVQKPLLALDHYASDGVEGLGYSVLVQGSKGRQHTSGLRMRGNLLGFVDGAGRSCQISFNFSRKPGEQGFLVAYEVSLVSNWKKIPDECGIVVFGGEVLYRASLGTLFEHIQTPD